MGKKNWLGRWLTFLAAVGFSVAIGFGMDQSLTVDASVKPHAVNVTDFHAKTVRNNWYSFKNDATTQHYKRVKSGLHLIVTWQVKNGHGTFYRITSLDHKIQYGLLDSRALVPEATSVNPYTAKIVKNGWWTFSDLGTSHRFKTIKAGQQARVTQELRNATGSYLRIAINNVDYGWLASQGVAKASSSNSVAPSLSSNLTPVKATGLSPISYTRHAFKGTTSPGVKVTFGRWNGKKFQNMGAATYADASGHFTFHLSSPVMPYTVYNLYTTNPVNNRGVRVDVRTPHNVLAFGDSITVAQEAGQSSYVRTATRTLGDDLTVAAQNGGRIEGNNWNDLAAQITTIGPSDLRYFDRISLAFGTNDWSHGTASLTSVTQALNEIIGLIKYNAPRAKLYGVLPSPRYATATAQQLLTTETRAGGYSYTALTNALSSAYQRQKMPVLDWRKTGLTFNHASFRDGYQHPTTAFQIQMAPFYQQLIDK